MFRVFVTLCILLGGPAFACENPFRAMAREPVAPVDQPAYAQAFNECFDVFLADLPAEHRDRIPEIVNDMLDFAVRSDDVVVVRRMLDEGADLDGRSDGSVLSPLAISVMAGHVDVLRLLLEAGADPNTDGEVISPLYLAIHDGQANIARVLHAAGGEVRRHPDTPDDVTLIEDVIYGGEGVAETIALLIELGYDPSAPMSGGIQPIHTAASLGDGETIRVLIAGGVDIEVRDRQDHTPLQTAAGTFMGISALPVLLELQATAIDAALYEAELNRYDMNAAYLRAIGDSDAQQAVLDQALITFIERLRGAQAYKLLRAGADPNAFRGEDNALYVANCAPPVGETLLRFGANPDLARVDGAAPDWAAECATYTDETRDYINRLGFVP